MKQWLDDIDSHFSTHPLIYVFTDKPKEQSPMHFELAMRGYIPALVETTELGDYWSFVHPDGPAK